MTNTRKIIIATGIACAAAVGGTAIAVAQGSSSSPDLDRAATVAAEEAGDGDVVGVEQDDDGTYEVDIRHTDGTESEVELSATFEVLRTEHDDDPLDDDSRDDDSRDDDRPLAEADRTRAGEAALASVGEGTVTSVEADDGGYDVEIRHADGTETDVSLDAEFAVIHSEPDDD